MVDFYIHDIHLCIASCIGLGVETIGELVGLQPCGHLRNAVCLCHLAFMHLPLATCVCIVLWASLGTQCWHSLGITSHSSLGIHLFHSWGCSVHLTSLGIHLFHSCSGNLELSTLHHWSLSCWTVEGAGFIGHHLALNWFTLVRATWNFPHCITGH